METIIRAKRRIIISARASLLGKRSYRVRLDRFGIERLRTVARENGKLDGRPPKKKSAKMSVYKRGGVYWYKFMWKGRLVRESTKNGNDKLARQMEAAHRTSLAKGESGNSGEEDNS